MTTLEKIKLFLNETNSISIGFHELFLYNPEELAVGQIGFRVDKNGASLLSEKDGGWKTSWLVIGMDVMLNNPILIDAGNAVLPVLSAQQKNGLWTTEFIADSLINFGQILIRLEQLSEHRNNYSQLEENPISGAELKTFFSFIKTKNPNSDIWFWRNFLEDDDD